MDTPLSSAEELVLLAIYDWEYRPPIQLIHHKSQPKSAPIEVRNPYSPVMLMVVQATLSSTRINVEAVLKSLRLLALVENSRCAVYFEAVWRLNDGKKIQMKVDENDGPPNRLKQSARGKYYSVEVRVLDTAWCCSAGYFLAPGDSFDGITLTQAGFMKARDLFGKPQLGVSTRGKPRRRGAPQSTDPKVDKQCWEAWKSGAYRNKADCAVELGIKLQEFEKSIDRHRKRLRRLGQIPVK